MCFQFECKHIQYRRETRVCTCENLKQTEPKCTGQIPTYFHWAVHSVLVGTTLPWTQRSFLFVLEDLPNHISHFPDRFSGEHWIWQLKTRPLEVIQLYNNFHLDRKKKHKE